MQKTSDTLNLPKTRFPMKANLTQLEPDILKYWEDNKIYIKISQKNKNKPCYILHDGPPFSNGNIHMGHALNKILKDIIVKFKNMTGFYAPYVPGWDTHGLPIELKSKNKLGTDEFNKLLAIELRKTCKETAMYYVNIQREQFKRIGIFGDWDNPYITLLPEFESKQIEVFAKMVEKGAIYQGLKPVHWCYSCKTALAEAEIEYKEDNCDSVYVKFQIDFNSCDKFNRIITKILDLQSEFDIELTKIYFIIWTTTIWTLPANVAICLNSEFEYSLVRNNNEFFIIATALVDKIFKHKNEDFSILFNCLGKEFENICAYHPFLDRSSRVILGNFVTLDSGTGCVHIAPGHGLEDFEVCLTYDNIPMIVSVDENGILTESAGKFAGTHIVNSGEIIKSELKTNNYLFNSRQIRHKYPHCWRCKEPVIFRATKQWFCSVELLKNQALNEVQNVHWMPAWGKERMELMIKERSDWCISRQRKWGVPIPIFLCSECRVPYINSELIMHIAKIFKELGTDSWWIYPIEYFLKHEIKCKNCGSHKFSKEIDIMDGWFDSGTSYYAVLTKKQFPADLYLEGSDQYRGWFQSSLLTSIAATGKAPYKNVLTHGWVIDNDGQKQSKSLGNVTAPEDVISKYGADIMRLWVASCDYTNNVAISQKILSQVSEFYRKFRNTARYILGNLYDYNPQKNIINSENLLLIDKFMVYKFNELFEKCLKFYQNFEFYKVFHFIREFCILDLSNFYLEIIKDRLYVELADSLKRRSAQTVLYVILNSLVRLMAPILSFTCEEIWGFLQTEILKNSLLESVFVNDIICEYKIEITREFKEYWQKVIKISDDVNKEIEIARKNKLIGSSLETSVTFFAESTDFEFINSAMEDIKSVLIVSEVKLKKINEIINENNKKLDNNKNILVTINKLSSKKCSRCWMHSNYVGTNSEFPDFCERCANIIKVLD
ncbi:MAG: isoleucine--tRNA ligase [Candidatus Improbicoccus devescovinae]|nr:MAG: isoleucine--tRNA ligase [Candidatus Improbicoccus devescovinae]